MTAKIFSLAVGVSLIGTAFAAQCPSDFFKETPQLPLRGPVRELLRGADYVLDAGTVHRPEQCRLTKNQLADVVDALRKFTFAGGSTSDGNHGRGDISINAKRAKDHLVDDAVTLGGSSAGSVQSESAAADARVPVVQPEDVRLVRTASKPAAEPAIGTLKDSLSFVGSPLPMRSGDGQAGRRTIPESARTRTDPISRKLDDARTELKTYFPENDAAELGEPPSPKEHHADSGPGGVRTAGVDLSQEMVNRAIKQVVTTPLFKDLSIELKAGRRPGDRQGRLILRGVLDLSDQLNYFAAMNGDATLTKFRFESAVKLEVTSNGYLLIIFPENQTTVWLRQNGTEIQKTLDADYFSYGLGYFRGYLSALAGDLSGFDRWIKNVQDRIEQIDRDIAAKTQSQKSGKLTRDEIDGLQSDIDDLQDEKAQKGFEALQIPFARRQAVRLSKSLKGTMFFIPQKDDMLHEEVLVHKTVLGLKIDIAQIAPWLKGTALGAAYVDQSPRGGSAPFLMIDVNQVGQ